MNQGILCLQNPSLAGDHSSKLPQILRPSGIKAIAANQRGLLRRVRDRETVSDETLLDGER
jgi:hypothetical protein